MNNKEEIVNVRVEDILPNRFQPRLAFDEQELSELSSSILKYGVLQPIILRKIGEKYEIVAGERRFKATVLAGIKTIPAIIKETDDNTSAEIALLENLQRKNLSVIEEAQSFKKLLDKGYTQDDIAKKLGVSQSSIANKLRLLNLPRKVQDAMLFNKISERHGRSLLSLNNKDKQEALLDKIINEKLTVKQTEEEISKEVNNYKVEDDIPDQIRKYIEREDADIEVSKPNIQQIETKEEIKPEEVNPFQVQFQDNIRKIEEKIQNKKESFYDEIINKDLNYDAEKDKLLVNDIYEKEINDIPFMIGKVRDFVNEFNGNNINKIEEDLPDRYKIIIEIKKDK